MHMPVQPGRPVLALVSAHHITRRVGQARAEQLHHRVPAGKAHGRLPEIDLGLGPGVVGQRQGHRSRRRRAMRTNPLPDRGLSAGKVVLGHQPFPDSLGRVPLLARAL